MSAAELENWVLEVMQSELARRQNDDVLALCDRHGHPVRDDRVDADRALAA